MRLKVVFANHEGKSYDLVAGSVFIENFNETLDSASIHLTNIYEEDRLHINPYDYCYIYDLDSDFIKYFVIDNYVESFVNITGNIYDYQINLMSPTKWLEKIQLPNRTILHSLVSGQLTITQHLQHFLSIYIPKIKLTKDGVNWSYDYLIDFSELLDETSEIYQKFNVKCPDLSWNNPTLREVINTLMSVVGCIVKIDNRKLSYLDLRANPNAFLIPTGKAFDFKKSLSSDSYVNTITTFAENLLGEDNRVKNEMLGFRDKDNVILKHDENLYITTSLPIAKVENLTLCGNCLTIVQRNLGYQLGNQGADDDIVIGWTINGSIICIGTRNGTYTPYISPVKISLYSGANIINTTDYSIRSVGTMTGSFVFENVRLGQFPLPSGVATQMNVGSNDWDYAVIEFNDYSFILVNDYKYKTYAPDVRGGYIYQNIYVYFVYRKDITPLVFEQGEKNMLSTVITQNPQLDEDFSEYKTCYYTTLSYQYGGTTIQGFSQKYSFVTWYGSRTEVFIYELWKDLVGTFPYGDFELGDLLKPFGIHNGSTFSKGTLQPATIVQNLSSYTDYAQLFFDITYQPFNSVNLKYSKKENIPIPIEQLDNQETAIPALIPFSLREQEKIDRLGNSVLQIHQSQVVDFNEINDVNSIYNDFTIFSREIQYYEGFAEVNYVATKNYVLKNYFTSIETKYRAYEYVDFGRTTIRKENIKVFVLLSDHFVNGDDKVRFWNNEILDNEENDLTYISKAFLNLADDTEETFTYRYAIKTQTEGQTTDGYKNDLSVIFYDNNIVLSSRDFDSVSEGIKLSDARQSTDTLVNGYLQEWIIRDDNVYKNGSVIWFTNYVLYKNNYVYDNESEINDAVERSFELPHLTFSPYFMRENNKYSTIEVSYNGYLYSIPNYFKSQDEVLSETIQFEYYSDNDFIEVAPLIHKISMLNTSQKEVYCIYNTTQKLNKDLQESSQYIPVNSIITRENDGSYTINWISSNINSIEIRLLDHEENGIFYGYSILRIKRDLGTKLYVSLNDTKTTDVYSLGDDDLLNLNYECDFSVRTRKCIEKE